MIDENCETCKKREANACETLNSASMNDISGIYLYTKLNGCSLYPRVGKDIDREFSIKNMELEALIMGDDETRLEVLKNVRSRELTDRKISIDELFNEVQKNIKEIRQIRLDCDKGGFGEHSIKDSHLTKKDLKKYKVPTNELELYISSLEIDGKEVPIKNMFVKINMITNHYGMGLTSKIHSRDVVILGRVEESIAGSNGSRSWNMNVDLEK